MIQWQQTINTITINIVITTQLVSYFINNYDFNESCMFYGISVTGVSFTKITCNISDHQYVMTSLSDGQGRALLTAHLLLQDLQRGIHCRLTSGAQIHTIVSVAN